MKINSENEVLSSREKRRIMLKKIVSFIIKVTNFPFFTPKTTEKSSKKWEKYNTGSTKQEKIKKSENSSRTSSKQWEKTKK